MTDSSTLDDQPGAQDLARDAALRRRAITHIEALMLRFGSALHWEQIAAGLDVDDQKVHLATRARGIFTPADRGLVGALSVRTAEPRRGRTRWYADGIEDREGLFTYAYQGSDPQSRDNRMVRACLRHNLPLLYFLGVAPARYLPIVCFVVGDESSELVFKLAPVTSDLRSASEILRSAAMAPPPAEQAYAVRMARQRLHQSRFREMILDAYQCRCAVCRLRHAPLLDAAHIIPDSEPDGRPVLANGLALCKLHHAAYDAQVLGITPDFQVRIAPGVMDEQDGPMLKHGLQGLNGERLTLPRDRADWPDQDRLLRRWSTLAWRG